MCKVCIEEYETINFCRTQVLYLPCLVSNLLTYSCLDLIYVTLAVADLGVEDSFDRLTTAFHNLAAVCILIKSRFVLFIGLVLQFLWQKHSTLGSVGTLAMFSASDQVGNIYHLDEETNFVVEKDIFVQSFIQI